MQSTEYSQYIILCEMPVVIPNWVIAVVYRPSALAQISSLYLENGLEQPSRKIE